MADKEEFAREEDFTNMLDVYQVNRSREASLDLSKDISASRSNT